MKPSEVLLNCPDIVEGILHGVPRSTLAVCLRVNRQFFYHAGRILYHTIRIDSSNIEGILLGAVDHHQGTSSNWRSTEGYHNQINISHKRESNVLDDDDITPSHSKGPKNQDMQKNQNMQKSPKMQKNSETATSQDPPPIPPITPIPMTPAPTITTLTRIEPIKFTGSIRSLTTRITVQTAGFKNDLLRHVLVVTLGTHTTQQCRLYRFRLSFPNVQTVRVSPSVCTSCASPVCVEPLCNDRHFGNPEAPQTCPLVDAAPSARKLVLRNFHKTTCQGSRRHYELSGLGRLDEMVVMLPTDGASYQTRAVLDHVRAQHFPLVPKLKVIFYGHFESSVQWPPAPLTRLPTPLNPDDVISPTLLLSYKTSSKETEVYALECVSFDLMSDDRNLIVLYGTRPHEYAQRTQASVRKLVKDELATRPLVAYLSHADVPPLFPGLGENVQFKTLAQYMNDDIKASKYELSDGSHWTSDW